jgi:hypothetical protein
MMETGRTLLHGVIIELSAQDAEIILVRQGLSGSLSLTHTKRLDSHVWRSHNKGGQAAKRFGNARGEVISEYIRKACDFVRGMLIPGVRVLIAGPPVVRAECKHCLERSTLPHRVQVATCPAPYDKGRHRTDSYVQLLGSLFPHGLAAEPVPPRQSGLSHAVRRAPKSRGGPPPVIDGTEHATNNAPTRGAVSSATSLPAAAASSLPAAAASSANVGSDGEANTPTTLHIRSGKPVNMFEAAAWPATFAEFFYGDCAPNLARPQRLGLRELCHYLATREELEYGLEADRDDVVTALNDADPAEDHLAPREEASLHDTPSISAFTEHHPDKSSGEAHTCVYCGRPNTRSCCACWQVTYCDRVCQKGHWPLHRVTCTSKRNR